MSFLALLYLCYLAGYLVVILLGVDVLHLFFEGIQLLTYALGLLLLCLLLAYLAYGVLYLLLLSFSSSSACCLAFASICLRLRSMSSMSLSYREIVFSISFSRWCMLCRLFSQ